MAFGFGASLKKKEKLLEQNKNQAIETNNFSVRENNQKMPFALVTPGKEVEVVTVRGKDDTRHFLANLGFVEGAKVSIVSENGGNIIASVKDSRVAINQNMAMRVMVV